MTNIELLRKKLNALRLEVDSSIVDDILKTANEVISELEPYKKQVKDFIQAIDEKANEGYDEENDEDWRGNPDFDSEAIADIACKHFNLYNRF